MLTPAGEKAFNEIYPLASAVGDIGEAARGWRAVGGIAGKIVVQDDFSIGEDRIGCAAASGMLKADTSRVAKVKRANMRID